MEHKKFSRYTALLIYNILAILIVMAAFNWLVNPLNIYAAPSIEGFNAIKTDSDHDRIIKKNAVSNMKPEVICLGSSRTEYGIDPTYEGWPSQPVYNLALRSASICEISEYFEYAKDAGSLKQVVLLLDFFSFRNSPEIESASKPSDFKDVLNSLELLVSKDILLSSLKCVVNQDESHDNSFFENGFMGDESLNCIGVTDNYHAGFLRNEKSYIIYSYLPECFMFTSSESNPPSVEYYRDILNTCYKNNIDLRIGISPCHARQWETLAASGLWNEFEMWKRILVQVNEEEARLSGETPFPLWDLSIYNEYTTEDLPDLEDTESEMRWYWDSSHYKKELGNLIIDCIFSNDTTLENNLGVLVTSENLEEHLQNVRNDRENYRTTHPEDVAEIESLVNKESVE